MKNKFLKIFSLLAIFLMLPNFTKAAEKLLQASDLTYVGAFRLPGGQYGGASDDPYSFHYAGSGVSTGITFNPANNSLFLAGHVYSDYVAEINIPATISSSTNINSLTTATVRQNFKDITQGQVPNLGGTGTNGSMNFGGMLVYNNKLIGSLYDYYDEDAEQPQWTHFVTSLTLGTGWVGTYKVLGGPAVSYLNGYMCNVPDNSGSGGTDWKTALGGPVLTGNSALAVTSRTSQGPAAFVFEPNNLGTNNQSVPLMYYTDPDHQYPGAAWRSNSDFYNGTADVRGVVFPVSSKSVLYFGAIGTGNFCYKTDSGCNGSDPYRPDVDVHAPPYRYQVWAYNADDLLAVKNGTKNPWEPSPQLWPITTPFDTGANISSGAAYDPATQRIYFSLDRGDGNMPLIAVFHVNAEVAPVDTTAPAAPTGLNVQ